MIICLDRGADLHIAQLMPLALTVSCFSKIQIGFTFLVPAHPGSPGQRGLVSSFLTAHQHIIGHFSAILDKGPLNGCVCVCICYHSFKPKPPILQFITLCSYYSCYSSSSSDNDVNSIPSNIAPRQILLTRDHLKPHF